MKKQVFRFTPSSSKKAAPAEADTRVASDEPPVDAVSVKIIADCERRERERAEEKKRTEQETSQAQPSSQPAQEENLQMWLDFYRLETDKKMQGLAAPQ